MRMSVPTKARIGRATPSSKPATGLPGSRSARVSQVASCAAMMLPPETDVNVSILREHPELVQAPERAQVEERRPVAAARHAQGGALPRSLSREVGGDAVRGGFAHDGV